MSFLSVLLFVVGICVVMALCIGATFVWSDYGPKWGAPMAVAAVLAFSGGLWFVFSSDTPGVHEWRGGSGPSTRCAYEIRDEARQSGKVTYTEQVTYTVCRDAQ